MRYYEQNLGWTASPDAFAGGTLAPVGDDPAGEMVPRCRAVRLPDPPREITEPRWARMVEIRPTTLKGRRVLHHSIAYLVLNNDPDAVNTGTTSGVGGGSALSAISAWRLSMGVTFEGAALPPLPGGADSA